MVEKDFIDLSGDRIPPPSPGSKARAINAALLAFDTQAQKNASRPQGIVSLQRLMSRFNQIWDRMMEKRVMTGALLAALLIAPATGIWTLQQSRTLNNTETRAPAPPPVTETTKQEARKDLDRLASIPDVDEKPKPPLVQPSSVAVNEDGTAVATGDRPPAALSPDLGAENIEKIVKELLPSKSGQPAKPKVDAALTDRAGTMGGATGKVAAAGQRKVQTLRVLPDGRVKAPQDGLAHVAPAAAPAPGTEADLTVPVYERMSRDRFEPFKPSPLKSVKQSPVSTFSIDVDTSSYAFVRRTLMEGRLPDPHVARVEEMINYFTYDYPRPANADMPFKPTVAVYPTPWNENTKLLHIGIKGHDIVPTEKPRSNLVFLVDVSGSMNSPDKLPLLKSSLKLLVNQLSADDTVSIVTYAGRAGTALEPTKVKDKQKIISALDVLQSGGSTAGAAGIQQAYNLARENFDNNGVNRVILATDGDFNVGISNPEALKKFIEQKRRTGIFLSVLGFGKGNYHDALMQALAQNGNGTAAYIDTLKEAQKTLVEEASSTLFPIAKDVKIQIEFNPKEVSEYRLIGYETRALKREDFNNDKVDAGDIGSGHTVTAVYEITPANAKVKMIDDLRYGKSETSEITQPDERSGGEYAFLKLRYKLPKEDKSKLITFPVTRASERQSVTSLSDDMRFAVSVAAFAQKLQGVTQLSDYRYHDIIALAQDARGADSYGYRAEFLSLLRIAQSLSDDLSKSVTRE